MTIEELDLFKKAQQILHHKYSQDWEAPGKYNGGPSPRASTVNPDGSVTINNKHGQLLKVITPEDLKEYEAQEAAREEQQRKYNEEQERIWEARREARKQRLARGEKDRPFDDLLSEATGLLTSACYKAIEAVKEAHKDDEELSYLLDFIDEAITNKLGSDEKYSLGSSLSWDYSDIKSEFLGEFRDSEEEEEE